MIKYVWPDGELMPVECPDCGNTVNVQIENVRDWDLPSRPDVCFDCGCEFDVSHTGKTTILHGHSKQSTAKGLELAKTLIIFDTIA